MVGHHTGIVQVGKIAARIDADDHGVGVDKSIGYFDVFRVISRQYVAFQVVNGRIGTEPQRIGFGQECDEGRRLLPAFRQFQGILKKEILVVEALFIGKMCDALVVIDNDMVQGGDPSFFRQGDG